GHVNSKFDDLLTFTSPFAAIKLAEPTFLANPEHEPIDLLPAVRVRDYAWLFLTVHDFHYVVLHKAPEFVPELPVKLSRLERLIEPAKVADDGTTAIYARSLLPPPTDLAMMCTQGWQRRFVWNHRYTCAVGKRAQLAVYNPDSEMPLT